MGKSMSVARTINKNPVQSANHITNVIQPKPNHKPLRKAHLTSEPTPEYVKKTNEIDRSFNDRLKQVYVTSVNKNTNLDLPKNRPLPMDRTAGPVDLPHSQLADELEPNRILIDDLKKILHNYKINPELYTPNFIAELYDINKETAEKLLVNYSLLEVHYSYQSSDSDKNLRKAPPVPNRLTKETTFYEMEDIIADKKQKWKKWEDV